jgi:exodeoxyribonuclease VII small subunit
MTKRATSKTGATKETDRGQQPSFEQALHRLEEIVTQLEGAEVPLERALKLYEEGVGLARRCAEQLQAAERRVEILEDEGGRLRGRPFADREGSGPAPAGQDEEEHAEADEDDDTGDKKDSPGSLF